MFLAVMTKWVFHNNYVGQRFMPINIKKPLKVTNPLPTYEKADNKNFIDLTRSALSTYNSEAIKQFGYLDNQGLALDDNEGDNSGPVFIDSLYVLPGASSVRQAPEELAQQEIDGKTEQVIPGEENELFSNIANLIWRNPRLTLLGDPGVGKTTLIQWLVCSLCHWNSNHAQQQIGKLFPLVLTARRLPQNIAKVDKLDNEAFISQLLTTQGQQLASLILGNQHANETLYQLLDLGQVLILVDGLDEISPDTSAWLNTQLRQLLRQYPKLRLLMTSRVVGFNAIEFWQIDVGGEYQKQKQEIAADEAQRQNQLKDDAIKQQANLPTNYFLAPFSPKQRQQFASNWVTNYLPPNQEKRQQFIDNIASISQHSLQLNALSRIPALLNLICFIQWRRGKLPNGRAELYQRIVETYLVAMDRARQMEAQLSDEYDYQDIKNWLGKLALQLHSGELICAGEQAQLAKLSEDKLETLRHQEAEIKPQRLTQLSEGELREFLQLQLTEVVETDRLQEQSEQLIDFIKKRTGFLIPKGQINGEEYFAFSHLSFQEYFAAYRISKHLGQPIANDSLTKKGLSDTILNPSWGEIWQLAFEELSFSDHSRSTIEQQLERLFPEPSRQLSNIRFWEDFPEQIKLYSKIILNPAVKLARNKRLVRQKKLVVDYLQNNCPADAAATAVVNHLLANWQQVSDILLDSKSLYLTDKKLTTYLWLCQLSELTKLYLNGTHITDLTPLAQLKQLTWLDLNRTDITELTPLAELKQLIWLYLSRTNITDLKPLEQLKQLTILDLSRTGITGLMPLAQLKQLAELNLSRTNISDPETLKQLKSRKVMIFQ